MLRENHRLRAFGSKVPRRIYGCKGEEKTGRWRNIK
jgi:hypothetical protein